MSDPVNLFEFEALAKDRIDPMAFGYYAAGANDGVTLRENRRAFDRIKLRPRMLRGVENRDLRTTVLDKTLPLPLMIAPTALAKMAHPDGEIGITTAAGALGLTTILSTASSTPLEDVAETATAPLWFQLYVYRDRAVTRSLVQRAEEAGYEALVVTVDTPLIGRREPDIRNSFHLPEGVTLANFSGPTLALLPVKPSDSGFDQYIASLWDSGLTWDDLDWLASLTSMPVLVKGVLRGDDAVRAFEHGATGVIVSNHGGRQLDTALASIEALPEVAEAVDGRMAVLLDGGIRRGTDILKALALGAQAVAIGRPMLWGLGYDGTAGVQTVLELLRDEFDLALALSGCTSVDEVTRDLVVLP